MRAHQPGSTPIDIPETVPIPPISCTRARTGATADKSAGQGARKSNRAEFRSCGNRTLIKPRK